MLSDSSRRQILMEVRNQGAIKPFSGDGTERNRAIQLRHVHLPLLEKNDLVVWNRETDTVAKGEDLETIGPLLTALAAQRDALSDEYLSKVGRPC